MDELCACNIQKFSVYNPTACIKEHFIFLLTQNSLNFWIIKPLHKFRLYIAGVLIVGKIAPQ